MGKEKWEFNTAWDWVRPFPNGDVLYDVTDSANILGAPAYTQKEYLNEIDWKNNESMEAFQRFINERDREPWQNTRFLSTLQPGMEFGNGDTAYKIVTGTDKRFIPKGYKIAGTLDSVYRPGYSRVSGQILNNPVKVAGTTIPGYTILQKEGADQEVNDNINYKPIDFDRLREDRGRYIMAANRPNASNQYNESPPLKSASYDGGKYSGIYSIPKRDLINSQNTKTTASSQAGKYMAALAQNIRPSNNYITSTHFNDVV